jgi:outer membrane protein TolC
LLLDTRQTLERERSSLAMQLPLLQQRWQELQQLSQQAMTQYDAQYQAWRQGSLPGFQWLQVQDSIWQLQQQADEARIQFSQSISHWNQLQGVLPE